MKVLICGSRTWTDAATIASDLAHLKARWGERLVVIHGACPRGADRHADVAAKASGIAVEALPAQWETHDRQHATAVPCRCSGGKRTCPAAGLRRNQQMLDRRPQLVVAYRAPGRSNGTDDMIRRARAAHIPTRIVHADSGRPELRLVREAGA